MFAPPLPEPLQALLLDVRAWADPARQGGSSGGNPGPSTARTAADRLAWVAGLRQLIDATESVYLQALADADSAGDPQTQHGARSTASWLQGALHLAPGEASSHVRMARATRGLLASSLTDLREGSVTVDHVAAIERAVHPVPPSAAEEAAELLGGLARRVDVGRLRAAGRALRHAVDPDGALCRAEQDHDRRYLYLSPLLDGTVAVDGLLDAEGAAALDTALAPFLVPAGEHDVRTSPQRRADGLVDLARSHMTNDPATLGGQPVQLQVLVPVSELTGRAGSATLDGVPRLAPSLRESTAMTADAMGRLACDASVSRLVFGPESHPLQLGRSQRLFSPAQRRALAFRDGGCRFPGCSRPPRFTDAHHIVSWSDGGASDLHNALLLCRYHHRLVHEGGWKVIDAGSPALDELAFCGPDGQRLVATPRAP